jgi:hypothetical protein
MTSAIYDGCDGPDGRTQSGAGDAQEGRKPLAGRSKGRSRTKSGRFRRKRSDAHLKGLEKTYGELSSKRSDTHLGTLREASGKSLSQMVR